MVVVEAVEEVVAVVEVDTKGEVAEVLVEVAVEEDVVGVPNNSSLPLSVPAMEQSTLLTKYATFMCVVLFVTMETVAGTHANLVMFDRLYLLMFSLFVTGS